MNLTAALPLLLAACAVDVPPNTPTLVQPVCIIWCVGAVEEATGYGDGSVSTGSVSQEARHGRSGRN